MESWQLIIIGAGPAGLTAGIYAGRSGLKTLILDEKMAGGEASVTPWIENYPGFESISGPELAERMANHCRKFGATIKELEKVVSIDVEDQKKRVQTDKATHSASALIVASGTHYRELQVPGEQGFRGKGVSYCAVCDGPFFKDKRVIVVGGGNSAVKSAIYLSNIASSVSLVHRRNELRADMIDVETLNQLDVQLLWNSEIKEIRGNDFVDSVIVKNNETGGIIETKADGVFVQIGELPNSKFAEEAGVNVDEDGFIIVDSHQRTNITGVFAAGDVTTGPVKQVGSAVGEAIIAATEAFLYVKRPYYYKGRV